MDFLFIAITLVFALITIALIVSVKKLGAFE